MNQPPLQRKKLLKEQSWVHRNPRAFISIATAGGLLILFSRPIYDMFFRDYSNVAPTPEKSLRKM